jgi:Ca2+-binding RTX toxin-like protein
VTINVAPAASGSVLTVTDSCMSGTALLITGTTAGDTIVVEPGSSSSTLTVKLNGVTRTVARPSGRIIIVGGDGNDDIQIAGSISNPAWLYGDAGDDKLNAGGGNSLMIGGDGSDQLTGGSGRDVIIGGKGADKLVGNAGDDLLVAGSITKDERSAAGHEEFYCDLLMEWASTNLFSARVQYLRSYLLPNVQDDGASDEVDFLQGSSGNDWLVFADGEDKVVGQSGAVN